jgi:multiple sugar transport system substrate-binding protein
VYEFEVGIAPIPHVEGKPAKVISQGPSLCIFKKSNPQEMVATWLFAKFLTTNVNFQANVSMNNGYAPVIRSVKDNPVYAEFLEEASTANITAYAVKVALEQEDAYYASPAFNGSSAARDQVGLLLQKCFILPDAGLEDAIKKAFAKAVEECKYQAGQ